MPVLKVKNYLRNIFNKMFLQEIETMSLLLLLLLLNSRDLPEILDLALLGEIIT